MGSVAAIFDLDRTILHGASGPAINEALRETGLRGSHFPGERLVYRLYDVFGENLLGMALARSAAYAVKGWSTAKVDEAARLAASSLQRRVGKYARGVIAEHRRQGHLLVLATTTPEVLVRPLAEALGFDTLLATRYAVSAGRLTGRIDGPFVWGPGKLEVVREWAEREGVTLGESFAYSDSIFDLPLLGAVGHPRAVNPDAALLSYATARRWPVLHFDAPPGVPKLAGIEPFHVARLFVRPELMPYARFEVSGIENIPDEGPFIIAANHRSYFDVAAIALVVARKGRPTRFLGKAELFDAPVVGQIARAFGGIRVDRAGAAADALIEAKRVLEAGEGLMVLPQGTIPRGRAFFDPVLRGKTGVARLAAATGAPVIPLAVWNTEAVWPRSSRVPNVVNVVSPPRVVVRVGPKVEGLALGAGDAARDTQVVMDAVAALLPPEARAARTPTEAELERTYPHGKRGEERALGVEPAS